VKRTVITVTPTKAGDWVVKGRPGKGGPVYFFVKSLAVGWAAQFARGLWESGKLAQVKVWRKDGRIHFERTYGKDPRRTLG
jgi:hypothetical protein